MAACTLGCGWQWVVAGKKASLVQGWGAVWQGEEHMEKLAKIPGTEDVGRKHKARTKMELFSEGKSLWS